MMRVLGVDPALKATGYAVIEAAEDSRAGLKLLEVGTIEPSQREETSIKIQKIYQHLDSIILEYSPTVMVLEKVYSHYKHPATASVIGHVRGAICLLSAQHKLRLAEYSVKRIRKVVVGNGAASKEQTRLSVAHIFKVDPLKLKLDASDALALALGYVYMNPARLSAAV
ncbi:MAG: crossover junction endodeoxyribonuclease RuvC [Candidatus Omnitrophica bacterium]|nr:crossover junction endodeoxyribonuclease RuvC [Candidatus Omnitrophota bacterium]